MWSELQWVATCGMSYTLEHCSVFDTQLAFSQGWTRFRYCKMNQYLCSSSEAEHIHISRTTWYSKLGGWCMHTCVCTWFSYCNSTPCSHSVVLCIQCDQVPVKLLLLPMEMHMYSTYVVTCEYSIMYTITITGPPIRLWAVLYYISTCSHSQSPV